MPTSYRIEKCPNNRAGCQNTECKKEGIKILKGELRFSTWVELPENASWKYKHWGCVTPQQFHGWNEMSDGNLDLVDGYEALSSELQEKVARALKQGHVDDSDWKGDMEKNRPGEKGFRLTPKQRQQLEAEEAGDGDASPPAKKPKSKKRTRKDDEEDEEDSGKAKKPSKKKARAVKEEDSDDAGAAPKKTSRGKKAKVEEDTDEGATGLPKRSNRTKTPKVAKTEPADPVPEKTKSKEPRRKKSAAAKVVDDEDDEDEGEIKPPKAKGKRGRPKKT